MAIGDLVLLLVIFISLNAGVLYLVIKAAVQKALSEDRMFQAKMRSANQQPN